MLSTLDISIMHIRAEKGSKKEKRKVPDSAPDDEWLIYRIKQIGTARLRNGEETDAKQIAFDTGKLGSPKNAEFFLCAPSRV
jgi:hypothetical protein